METDAIDVRPIFSTQNHARTQGAVSVPLADLAARIYELPPPYEAPLSIGGPSTADVRIALDILQAAGCVVFCFPPLIDRLCRDRDSRRIFWG